MSIVCVKGKGRDERTERSSVNDEYRTENRALGDTTRGIMQGKQFVLTFNTEISRRQIGFKPVENDQSILVPIPLKPVTV